MNQWEQKLNPKYGLQTKLENTIIAEKDYIIPENISELLRILQDVDKIHDEGFSKTFMPEGQAALMSALNSKQHRENIMDMHKQVTHIKGHQINEFINNYNDFKSNPEPWESLKDKMLELEAYLKREGYIK